MVETTLTRVNTMPAKMDFFIDKSPLILNRSDIDRVSPYRGRGSCRRIGHRWSLYDVRRTGQSSRRTCR